MNTVLSRIKEISSAVMYAAEASDLEAVLVRIAEVSKELAGTKYAALGIPDGQGGLTYFKTAGISAEDYAKIPHLPKGHGLIGAIMTEQRAIRLLHMKDDARSVGFPEHHPHMDSFLGVPIIVGQHLFGMLYLSDKVNGEPFNDDDQMLVETMAGFAALTIAGAQLREQQSRVNLLEERERIGMELHDGVIQSLYGIGIQVDIMRKQGASVPTGKLNLVVDSLNDVIEDIRRFITNLRQHDSDQLTIRECLNFIKERLHPPQTILFDIDAPDTPPPFTPAVFESICLIANEAVSNAIRHANAKQVHIHAEVVSSNFLITISDDGQGFNPENANNQTGLGLRNMQQRARLYGGEVTIESEENKGTRLTIKIPIR
ncbi:MAG: GAF domain-containing sensor histidine kinase [Anaerolineae bacterium]|nr:GAF domain-containing sensor histidine kinase [Anaerolineae bacterium]